MSNALQLTESIELIVRHGGICTARIADEDWILREHLPNPLAVIDFLTSRKERIDIYTFAQRYPDSVPRYNYPMQWENVAVAEFDSYSHWHRRLNKGAKSAIKQASRSGLAVREFKLNAESAHAIAHIYNESPIRQGKSFSHFGKSPEEVLSENSSYRERSVFIGAFVEHKLVGFGKIVFDTATARIMQILSMYEFRSHCPTNAILSEAVRTCADNGVHVLFYGRFDYGAGERTPLASFKHHNGFRRKDVPRYYCPLTIRARIYVALQLHRGLKLFVPRTAWSTALAIRRRIIGGGNNA